MSQPATSPASPGAAAVPAHSRFRVAEGCLDCVGDLQGTLGRLPGVGAVVVLGAAGIVTVTHDGRLDPAQVADQACQLGLRLEPADTPPAASASAPGPGRGWWLTQRLLALLAAGGLLLGGLAADTLVHQHTLALALYLATVAVGGVFPVGTAIKVLRRRRLTIGTLLVIATAGALALGVVEEAAMLVVVFSLGEVLEDYVSDRARGAIRALMALAPPTAHRQAPDGCLEEVPVQRLQPGEVVLVRPGERLPTDGIVVAGASAVDQSPVTGESLPVEATPGTAVFGGTVNGTGALTVKVTKPYQDTMLARIIRQVEQAQAHKGRAQRFADRFGATYTPLMVTLAVLVAVVPPLLLGDWRGWLYRGLVVLVVSCSCALVISVPVAVIAAISRAARDGILIKGGAHLEALGRVRVVALDKTGTLTRGHPQLTDVVPLDGQAGEQVLALAAAVEATSEHPLAGAILDAAGERGLAWPPGDRLRATPGVGVEATVGGLRLFVGRPDGRILTGQAAQRLAALETAGKTTIVLAVDTRPLGLLAVADQLRPEATQAVAELNALGLRVAMLSGDHERVAAAIACQTGIEDWRANLLPADKTSVVQELRRVHGPVAMVGDGINDAPALAAADVGVAMGAAGTDVALETADLALLADDLAKLPHAVRLARRALANIRQNIALSLVTVAVLVAAALAGRLSLASGLLLNEGTALLIIANGLRLLRPARPSTSTPQNTQHPGGG
jgi:Cd2+/Zn2+-exporting ATPase